MPTMVVVVVEGWKGVVESAQTGRNVDKKRKKRVNKKVGRKEGRKVRKEV